MAFTAEQRKAHRATQRVAAGDTQVTPDTHEVTPTVTQVTPTIESVTALLDGTPELAATVVSTPTIEADSRFTYTDDPDDPIIGLSALTARMAITSSGKLVDTRKLNEEQMRAAGIWLGPDPANADMKAVKAPKKRW